MAIDRSRLPTLGPIQPVRFPSVVKHLGPNGLSVWTVEHRELPIISAALLLRVGVSADPEDRPGLASFSTDLLDEGCGDLDALEVGERLLGLGASCRTHVGPDATVMSIASPARFAEPAIALLSDMVARPRFDPEDVERLRSTRLARLTQQRTIPSMLADRLFYQRLYGSHPYAHPALGTESSVAAMTLEELRQFHAERIRRAPAVLIVGGDASHEELYGIVRHVWSAGDESTALQGTDAAAASDEWSSAPPPESVVARPPAPPPGLPRIAIVDRPGAAQSELRVGRVGAARSTPDYHALSVLNTAFGGAFVSRINVNLREERALTYGARSSFDCRLGPGPFCVSTSVQSDATALAVGEILREIREVRDERPVAGDELRRAQAARVRGFASGFETGGQLVQAATRLALYDLPENYFDTYVPSIEAVTETEVAAAAERHLRLDDLQVVVVGDRGKTFAALEQLGLGVPIDVQADGTSDTPPLDVSPV